MFRFTSIVTPGTTNEVVIVRCANCNSVTPCHFYVPWACEYCKKPLEDAINLKDSARHKLRFHRRKRK